MSVSHFRRSERGRHLNLGRLREGPGESRQLRRGLDGVHAEGGLLRHPGREREV